MYDDILLPVDGSEAATEILEHAGAIARWADASVQLVYVADTTRDSVVVARSGVVDALVQKGEDIVADAAKTLESSGVDYDTDVVQGAPAATIVDYAERYEYDLVVMPTHGREDLSRYLLGSVTEKVVRLSSVPVLTARMRPDEELTFPYERILVPTDGSDVARAATGHAVALAGALDATVHALSVVDEATLGPDVRSSMSADAEADARDAVEAVEAAAADRGVTDVVTHVVSGTPDEEIRDCIESNDLHAVVMGTRGRQGLDRILLGSVAERTVRTAPVPVVTVRPEE